jgi:hypothetical protein
MSTPSDRPPRVSQAASLSSTVILTVALCGCGGQKAYLSSTASSCSAASAALITNTQPATVLKEAYARARAGAFARPDLVSAAIDKDELNAASVRMDRLTDTLRRLRSDARARQAAGASARPPSSAAAAVRAVLVGRVPWLANYPDTMVPDNGAGGPALAAAVDVIEFAGKKQAALQARQVRPPPTSTAPGTPATVATASSAPAATAPSMGPDLDTTDKDTAYSRDDHTTLQHAWQHFAGLQPFHLLTLFTADRIIEKFSSSSPPQDPEQVVGLVRLFNVANFLATYFDAYFGEGQFIQVSLERKPFIDDVITDLKRAGGGTIANENELRNALDRACTGKGTTCFSAGNISTTGFVSLFGDTTQFGEVKIDFGGKAGSPLYRPSISRPGVDEFGPQLVRVLVEALADANGPHPAGAPTSTACSGSPRLFSDEDTPGQKQCLAAASAEDEGWKRINAVGNATESVVTTGVGAVIRGANMGALNNETIAAIVETFAGVTARKTVQKAMSVCTPEQAANKGNARQTPPHVQVTNYTGPLDR